MNLTPRDRRALAYGGGALLAIAIYFGVIENVAEWYGDIRTEHRRAAEKIHHAVNASRQLSEFESSIESWQHKAGVLVTTRPYSEQITAIGSRIVAVAGESGVQLQGATPTVPTPWTDGTGFASAGGASADAMEHALINIDAQAEWENIFKFIAALYHVEGVLSVEQMDLSGEAKAGPLKMRLSVSILMKASGTEGPWR